jgi:hypothetical protein
MMKNWLRAQPASPPPSPSCRSYPKPSPASTTPGDRTVPCRTAPPPTTPAPGDRTADTHDRVRIDPAGKLTLRVNGRLHHIRTNTEHARTQVLILVQDLHVRIINAATGELIRELDIDPARDYQPLGRPPGPQPK